MLRAGRCAGGGRGASASPVLTVCPPQVLERHKASVLTPLTAYSVSQPSLEAVFLRVCGHKLDASGEYLQEEEPELRR